MRRAPFAVVFETVLTLGIDLSSQPKATAACVLDWADGQAVARLPQLACTGLVPSPSWLLACALRP